MSTSKLEEAVRATGAFDGKSCLIAAPTNTGKSYVAQQLVVRYLEVQELGYTSVYLCPYKALAEEIHLSLQRIIQKRIQQIEAESEDERSVLRDRMPILSTGDYVDDIDFSTAPLLVATYEKFAALLSKRKDFRPHVVVADEVQLVADPTRGARAEFLLASLAESEELGHKVYFYPLSAVIGNVKLLANWLRVPKVEGDESFRFVPLNIEKPCIHESEPAKEHIRRSVVTEIKAKRQVLVLDPSRRTSSEVRAAALADHVDAHLSRAERAECEALADRLESFAPYLRPLATIVRKGVAYHHAGLDLQARRLIERAFREKGLPKVICASPTLAAGINLPAARVILRNPEHLPGPVPLTAAECLNMLGRAGRYIPEKNEQTPGVANICLTAEQMERCRPMLEDVAKRKPDNVRSRIRDSLSHVMDFILWSIRLRGKKSMDQLFAAYRRTLWATEQASSKAPRLVGSVTSLFRPVLDHQENFDDMKIASPPFITDGRLSGIVQSGRGEYEVTIPANGFVTCRGPQPHKAEHCKHMRRLLYAALISGKQGMLPIFAFDAALARVPEFGSNMPPERIIQYAVQVLQNWEFLSETKGAYDVTEDGAIAAASWLPKSLVHSLRDRIARAPKNATAKDAISWAVKHVAEFGKSDKWVEPCLTRWLAGDPSEAVHDCVRDNVGGNSGKGYQDFRDVIDHMVTILRTLRDFARVRKRDALSRVLLEATRKVQHGLPDDGLALACMNLQSLNRDRLLVLYAHGVKRLDDLAKLPAGRVTHKQPMEECDIAMPYWRNRAFNILDNAIQNVTEAGTEPIPIFGAPLERHTGDIKRFPWSGIVAEGKKSHVSKVPCHSDLERRFADFLDAADDVVKYLKNERFGFYVTYYEASRPRHYFPDFLVVARDPDGEEVTWVIETKGEIRSNTMLKRHAADSFCKKMTEAREGRWRHLFVPQAYFEQALAAGVDTLEALDEWLRSRNKSVQLKIIKLEDHRAKQEAYKTMLPVYSIRAAAGKFGHGQKATPSGWVEAAGLGRLEESLFVVTADGKSMEPEIRDKDLVVFRVKKKVEPGRIVLAEYGAVVDDPSSASYAVKKLTTELVEEDGRRATRVVLRSLNPDHGDITIPPDRLSELRIVAEYEAVLRAQ